MVGNTDSLSPDNIVALATRALGADDSTSNALQTPYEAVALIGHACMLAVGFRLVGLGEDDNLQNPDSPTLPAQWNAATTYAFRYAHSQSSMQYLLKVSRLGNNAVVFALALGDDRTTSFDIPVNDFVSPSSLPLSSPANPPDALRDVFISASRLTDLIGLFRINVIQRLAPGLYKEGYEASNEARRERQPEAPPRHDPLRDDPMPAPARPYPFDDPLAIPPRRPVPAGDFAPPGFEDEFEIQRPPRGFAPGFGGRHPMNIGDRDLYPPGLGPHDPIRGGVGPGLGGYGGGGGGGGGMHPTFDDPLFGGQGGGEGGYNPQAPPGARYDPVGPGGPPFGRGPGRSGGRGGGGFGGGFGGMGGFGGDII